MAPLPARFVRPAYEDASVLNLPATIGAALGVRTGWRTAPLAACGDAIMPRLDGHAPWDRVVLVLLDGFGWDRWTAAIGEEAAPLADRLDTLGGAVHRITSVAPSTTSVATTSLLGNGASPIEHGLVGFSARLRVPGLVANLLFWRPEHGPGGSLDAWGIAPETFVARPSIFAVLRAAGVAATAFMPTSIADSPLSRAAMQGAESYPWVNVDDALHGVAEWMHADAPRGFAYLYVPDLDTLSHRDGPEGGAGRASLASIAERLGAWLDATAAKARARTLVLMTADHGHAATPPEQAHTLQPGAPEDDAILQMLASPPGGEARHVYLYALAGAQRELEEACESRLGASFAVMSGEAAVDAGLYGPPERAHPDGRARIGDVVLLAKGGATFWWSAPDRFPLGMHGSLEPAEMYVPLVAFQV